MWKVLGWLYVSTLHESRSIINISLRISRRPLELDDSLIVLPPLSHWR
jgi:hypothetical protein